MTFIQRSGWCLLPSTWGSVALPLLGSAQAQLAGPVPVAELAADGSAGRIEAPSCVATTLTPDNGACISRMCHVGRLRLSPRASRLGTHRALRFPEAE